LQLERETQPANKRQQRPGDEGCCLINYGLDLFVALSLWKTCSRMGNKVKRSPVVFHVQAAMTALLTLIVEEDKGGVNPAQSFPGLLT